MGATSSSALSTAAPPKNQSRLMKLGKKGRIAVIPSMDLYNVLSERISTTKAVEVLHAVAGELNWTINPALYFDMEAEHIHAAIYDQLTKKLAEDPENILKVKDLSWVGYSSYEDGTSRLRWGEPVADVAGDQLMGTFDAMCIFICATFVDEHADRDLLEICGGFIDVFIKNWLERGGGVPLEHDEEEIQDEMARDEDLMLDAAAGPEEEGFEDGLLRADEILKTLDTRLLVVEGSNTFVYNPDGKFTLEEHASRRTVALCRIQARKKAIATYRAEQLKLKKAQESSIALKEQTIAAAIAAAKHALLHDKEFLKLIQEEAKKEVQRIVPQMAAEAARKLLHEHMQAEHPKRKSAPSSGSGSRFLFPAVSPTRLPKSPKRSRSGRR